MKRKVTFAAILGMAAGVVLVRLYDRYGKKWVEAQKEKIMQKLEEKGYIKPSQEVMEEILEEIKAEEKEKENAKKETKKK